MFHDSYFDTKLYVSLQKKLTKIAIKLEIEDQLDPYSDEAIQNKLREIIAQGPNPQGYPNFIRDLFEVDEYTRHDPSPST